MCVFFVSCLRTYRVRVKISNFFFVPSFLPFFFELQLNNNTKSNQTNPIQTGNGPGISKFASRGGPNGSKNIRKTFGAELADPYAESDTKELIGLVDEVLRIIGLTMISLGDNPNTIPGSEYESLLRNAVNSNKKDVNGIITSLEYLRDRIGVPRDLPLASARYLRAYLNWAIDVLRVQ